MEKRKIIISVIIVAFIILSGCAENHKDKFIYGNATIEEIDILILESFPVQVNIIVKGYLPDSCTEIDKIVKNRDENIFSITITTIRPADVVCEHLPYFFEEVIPLDVYGLRAGVYNVTVNGASGSFEFTVDNILPE